MAENEKFDLPPWPHVVNLHMSFATRHDPAVPTYLAEGGEGGEGDLIYGLLPWPFPVIPDVGEDITIEIPLDLYSPTTRGKTQSVQVIRRAWGLKTSDGTDPWVNIEVELRTFSKDKETIDCMDVIGTKEEIVAKLKAAGWEAYTSDDL